MAKKGRRVRRSRRAQPKPQEQPAQQEPPPTKQELTEEELREEYAYVLKDLRRVAILAAVMFALLIFLNLLLQ